MKCCLIGSGGSLGDALLNIFKEDYTVYACHRERKPSCNEVIPVSLDLDNPKSVSSLIDRFSSIAFDTIVVNAGRNTDRLLVRESCENMLSEIEAFIIRIRKIVFSLCSNTGNASVIYISSMAGIRGSVGQVVYSTIKGAMHGLSVETALSFAEKRICSNTVIPGVFPSKISEATDKRKIEALREQNLLKCYQDTEEIASFIYHLSKMRRVSGQLFNLDSRVLIR